MPWVFTQHYPLYTGEFISEAEKRGIALDLATLRELYRRRLLIPFVELTYRPVRAPSKPAEPDPMPTAGRLVELRRARDEGCLRDLSTETFRPSVPFERGTQKAPGWWNGLLYSWYQLLALPTFEDILAQRKYQRRGTRRIARLPGPDPLLVERTERLRKMTIALTALETRYLPSLDPEWITLHNADMAEWESYRAGFDPVQMQAWLQYPSERLGQDAEWLLHRAYRTDPVGADWSRLMRRAPARSREYLKDASLLALDDCIAGEILLRFYEDLALRGQAEPLPDLSGSMAWHPLRERLSNHPGTLDEDLIRLGISAHPRVVLALEGETEMYHAPLIWKALGYSDAPELMRLLKLRGVDQDLTKVAAVAVAPLVGGKVLANEWKLIKPYTRLLVAVDPEGPYATPEKVESERNKILDEIRDVLEAQGVEHPNPEELDHLVDIRPWDESCYEFAHFTDDELADGIMAVHHTIDGWTRAQLVEALGYWRGRQQDFKRVWTSGRWDEQARRMTGKWEYEVSKVRLAEVLWPTLLEKIQLCLTAPGAPVPPIVKVISDAYQLAQQWRYLSFILTEVPDGQTEGATSDASGGQSPDAVIS
jgi:antitoxin component HigA of HigAB toxin-antitoxin module